MFNSKTLKILLAFLGLVVLVTVGFGSRYWYWGKTSLKPGPTQQESCQDCIQPLPAPDTSSWKTYRNEELGFEVKYPEGLQVMDYTMCFQDYRKDYLLRCKAEQNCAAGPVPKNIIRFQSSADTEVVSKSDPLYEPDVFSVYLYESDATGRGGEKIFLGNLEWELVGLNSQLKELSEGIFTQRVNYRINRADNQYVVSFSSKIGQNDYINWINAIVSTFEFLK
jgi:hypothetical protein